MQVDTLPHWIGPLHYLCAMPEKVDIKAVLWRNLNTLMAQQWGGENLTRLAREAGFAPATATRLKNQETSIGIDILEQLAAVFKVDAWQLLYRGLDASLAGDAARMFDQIDQGLSDSEWYPLAPSYRIRYAAHMDRTDRRIWLACSAVSLVVPSVTFPEVRRWIGVTPRLSLVGIKAPAIHLSLEVDL